MLKNLAQLRAELSECPGINFSPGPRIPFPVRAR
jgi:hypothetical protein